MPDQPTEATARCTVIASKKSKTTQARKIHTQHTKERFARRRKTQPIPLMHSTKQARGRAIHKTNP